MYKSFCVNALGAVAAAFLLASCVLGPAYKRPANSLDSAFIGAGSAVLNAKPVGADVVTFWRGFNDASLSRLVEQGLQANGDVRIAAARLREARANQAEADAAAFPSFGVEAGATRSVTPRVQLPGLSRSQRTGSVYDAGFIANWELDLFGRYRKGSEAAAAQTAASAASLGAAHTSVAAEIARNYLELRGLQQRLAFAREALTNQRESLRIAEARLAGGRITQLDVSRATSLVANTEAVLPTLQTTIEHAVFRLATLTAQPPRPLLLALGQPAPLPGLPVTDLSTLPVGTPEAWLERRPDVLAAEGQLAAATAGISIAKADLFPRLTLSGLLGLNAGTLGNLVKSDSAVYTLGAGLTWTLFDFGRLRARVVASKARTQQSVANYEQTVMTALEEIEGAFSSFNRNAERAQKLDVAARAASEAAQLARVRYSAGVTDFLVVLDAEREMLNNRDLLVQAQSNTATSLVAVYRALGGGWNPALVASEPARPLAVSQ